jgi:hypothetical protein
MANGKTFAEVIGELEGGQFAEELAQAWTDMVAAVMETNKPGSITLTVGITPTGRRTVKVAAVMKAKEPEHPRDATTFFVGNGNELFRDDPAQAQLPLGKVVRMPDTGDVRRVGGVDAAE